jgi:hypothetical protein
VSRLPLRKVAFALTIWLLAGSYAPTGRAVLGVAGGAQRLAPPESVKCPRNSLTVYEGRVTTYRRAAGQTSLRIHTDAGTNESVIVRHGRGEDPARWFLLWAEPFQPGDWRLIESRKGRLRPGMRANAWVCDDGSNPVIDWRPHRD